MNICMRRTDSSGVGLTTTTDYCIIECLLVLCVQAWSYYNEYRRDPWHIKLLVRHCARYLVQTSQLTVLQVGIIFMGNLLHQIFLSYSCESFHTPHKHT